MTVSRYTQHPEYWAALLASSIAHNQAHIKDHPKIARNELRSVVRQYLNSGVPSAETARRIREALR